MTFSTVVSLLAGIAAVLNLAMAAWYVGVINRAKRLEALLGDLCIEACLYQHAPYWKVWQETFGYQIEVRVARRQSDRMSDSAKGGGR